MILTPKDDKKGKFYKLSMFQRSALTLENYASSHFGSRFYSEEFLEGFCNQRNQIHRKVEKAGMGLISLTTVLAFFDNIEGTTQIFGIVFSIPPIAAAALCVLVAMAIVTWVIAMTDQLIIDRHMSSLGRRIGIRNFEVILLNYSSKNLWVSALEPKYFGLASEKGQMASYLIISLFFLTVGLALFVYPISVIFFTSLKILSNDPSNVARILISLSGIAVFFSVIFILVFSWSYKFRPTGLSEPHDIKVPDNYFDLGGPILEPDQNNTHAK